MLRLLLHCLLMLAAALTVNATMHLLNLLLIRSAWPYDVYVGVYAVLASPIIPLYGLISGAPSWYAPAPQGGLVLRLIVLNGLVWGMVAAMSWATLHRIATRWNRDVWRVRATLTSPRLAPFAILILALSLTVLSLWHIEPAACAVRRCSDGRLQAGFPLIMVRDDVGGSPISGWGNLGTEDLADARPAALLGNVVISSGLIGVLWIGIVLIRHGRGKTTQPPGRSRA
ncbi:MAG TPA: hypothetical protein VFZ66_05960 [Herpetosiphonaceae bacterium]